MPAVVLVGVPFDGGVALNGGRVGAKGGPGAFREMVMRAGGVFDAVLGGEIGVEVFDAGDVDVVDGETEAALEATHERVRGVFRALHERGAVTVGIGGGHDLTAAMVEGAMAGRGVSGVGGVNVDPHLDVREEVGSGMPFRRLIERGVVDGARYSTVGVGRFANSRAHVEWLRSRGGRVVTLEEGRSGGMWGPRFEAALRGAGLVGDGHGVGFVSFDLDALDGSVGPGVSAVNASGLMSAEAMEVAELAGRAPGVVHFDVMELNPLFDVDTRTARVAAALVMRFVAGVGAR